MNILVIISSIANLLKSISVRLTTTFLFAVIILLLCGDIETNPGPYTIKNLYKALFIRETPD